MFSKSRLLLLGLLSCIMFASVVANCQAQDLESEVLDWGGQSGYCDETYLVARTEAEWTAIWERHVRPFLDPEPAPEIDFAEKMLLCAFMGEQPTSGYRIRIGRTWIEDEKIQVEIIKGVPRNDSVVAQVITYPYVFASLDTSSMEIVFHVPGENGYEEVHITPELTGPAFAIIGLVALSLVTVALYRFGKVFKN